jgi:hypothetical protein
MQTDPIGTPPALVVSARGDFAAGSRRGTIRHRGVSRKIVMVRGWIVQDRGWKALSSEEDCRKLPVVICS